MDDTFLLFGSTEHVGNFLKNLTKQKKNMSFTSEIEQNESLSFLNNKTNHESNKFLTSVYRKLTFIGVFRNFESFISKCYKRSLTEDLVYAPIWRRFMRKLVL